MNLGQHDVTGPLTLYLPAVTLEQPYELAPGDDR
jgi:hypothetical protein